MDSAINSAVKRNNYAAMRPLQQLRQQLTEHVLTGDPLPVTTTAENILERKRGIGELINSWNPEVKTAYTGIKKQIYNALDSELDRLVPESQSLNQRISSLIPVREAAKRQTLAPDIVQRSLNRFATPTGALVGGLLGTGAGYEKHGLPGALVGGTVGLIAPEVLVSPGFRMFMARAMANPALRETISRGGVGALMQRYQQQQSEGTQP